MRLARGIIAFATPYLFPVFCLQCNKEGHLLCPSCFSGIKIHPVFACPVCHTETDGGRVCPACTLKSFLVSEIAMTKKDKDSIVSKLIEQWKYQFVDESMDIFSRLLADFFGKFPQIYSNIDMIIPVPLHPRRYAERGFNQSEEIAKAFSVLLHIPVESKILVRRRYTKQQAKLHRDERLENMADAFGIREEKKKALAWKRVLLVDDVFTTGSTMQTCAEILCEKGNAEQVHGFTLARG